MPALHKDADTLRQVSIPGGVEGAVANTASREEEKKKKGRGSQDKGKNERSGSIISDTAVPEDRIGMPKGINRKRKQSEDAIPNPQRKVSRPSISRAESTNPMQSGRVEPVNVGYATNGNFPPPPNPVQSLGNPPPLFPTMATEDKMILAASFPQSGSKVHALHSLRDQFGMIANTGGCEASPQSYVSSPTTSIVGPPSLQGGVQFGESLSGPIVVAGYAGSSSSRSPPSTGTPPEHSTLLVPRLMGTDPRHPDLPEPGLLNHLVDVYFKCVYSQSYAFLHRPTFMRDMNEHAPVLLFSICAVASRFSEKPTLEEFFAERARGLILQLYDSFTIQVVQSMINMGLHDFGSNKGNKAWMFCGMAVRMGASMNLNLENRKNKDRSVVEKEVYRRTYWSYYLMDVSFG